MVKEAVEAGADIIMLDNMTPEQMKEAVAYIDGQSRDRMFRQCNTGKYPENDRCRSGLYFQRCTDTFRTDPGHFT